MEKVQKVSSCLLNSKSRLSVVGTFQVIQDALTELMGTLKIDGITARREYNAFWVFAKTKVKFFKSFEWNDEMFISAYVSSKTLVKLMLNVEIKDKSGNMAICAKTELCPLDADTFGVRKLDSVGVRDDMISNAQTADIEFNRIDEDNLQDLGSVQIKSTNIDFCHHTNNEEYVRLIMNTYSVREMEENPPREMQVVYVSQSFENDILNIKKASKEKKDVFVLEKDEKAVVKCEIIF